MNEEKISALGNKLFASAEGRELMIKLKTDIQNTLVFVMNNSQRNNLRNGLRDNKTIEDILKIAKEKLLKLNKTEENIFAVSKSTSVIFKELDYFDYGTLSGLTKIYNTLNNDNMETPDFREPFKNDLTIIFTNMARNNKQVVMGDIQTEAVNYATDMCIELDEKSEGLLTDKMILDITNQVCDVIDMFFLEFKNSNNMRNLTIEQTKLLVFQYKLRKMID